MKGLIIIYRRARRTGAGPARRSAEDCSGSPPHPPSATFAKERRGPRTTAYATRRKVRSGSMPWTWRIAFMVIY